MDFPTIIDRAGVDSSLVHTLHLGIPTRSSTIRKLKKKEQRKRCMENITYDAANGVPQKWLAKTTTQFSDMMNDLGTDNVKRLVVGCNVEPGSGFKPIEGYAISLDPQTPFKARFFNTEEMFRGCCVGFFANRSCGIDGKMSNDDGLPGKKVLDELRNACIETLADVQEDRNLMSLKFGRRRFPTVTMFIEPVSGHHYLACEAHMLPMSEEVKKLYPDIPDGANMSDEDGRIGLTPTTSDFDEDGVCPIDIDDDDDDDDEWFDGDDDTGTLNPAGTYMKQYGTEKDYDFCVAIERLSAQGATFADMFMPSNSSVNLFLRRYYESQKMFREKLYVNIRQRLLRHYLTGKMLQREMENDRSKIITHNITNAVHKLEDGNLAYYSNMVHGSLGEGTLVFGGPFGWSVWINSRLGRSAVKNANMLAAVPFEMPKLATDEKVTKEVAEATRNGTRIDSPNFVNTYETTEDPYTHVYSEIPSLEDLKMRIGQSDYAYDERDSGENYRGDALWFDSGVDVVTKRLTIASGSTDQIIRLYSPHEWRYYTKGIDKTSTSQDLQTLGVSVDGERNSFLLPTYSATLTMPSPNSAFYSLNATEAKIVV